MSYLVIPKSIQTYNQGKNKNIDIYVFTYIKLCSNFNTGISNITEKTLSKLTDIPLGTVENIISRLKKDDSLLKVETKQMNETIRKNIYKFEINPDHHFYIDTQFFYSDIPLEIKGFLLLLKSIAFNNTNTILTKSGKNNKVNISDIARKLNQDRDKVSKLLKQCIALNQLKEIDNGFIILNEHILLSVKETAENLAYKVISDFCNSKGIVPPVRNNDILTIICTKYDLFGYLSDSIEDERNLYYQIYKRCKNVPKTVNLEYFLKSLCNIDLPKKDHTKQNFDFIQL